MQIRFNSTTVRKAMNSASLKISSLSLQIRLSSQEICSQRQVSLQFHHLVGRYHPKKRKIEHRQKAKLRENQCTYFHDSCSWCHFDSPETLRAIKYLTQRLIFQPGLKFVIFATKFQPCLPGWNFSPGWNSPCNLALKYIRVGLKHFCYDEVPMLSEWWQQG